MNRNVLTTLTFPCWCSAFRHNWCMISRHVPPSAFPLSSPSRLHRRTSKRSSWGGYWRKGLSIFALEIHSKTPDRSNLWDSVLRLVRVRELPTKNSPFFGRNHGLWNLWVHSSVEPQVDLNSNQGATRLVYIFFLYMAQIALPK